MNRTAQLFPLGRTVITCGAQALLAAVYPSQGERAACALLWRHAEGDWGNLEAEDRQLNDMALKDGSRIFSAYDLPSGDRLWVITEADRSSTTILRPDEY